MICFTIASFSAFTSSSSLADRLLAAGKENHANSVYHWFHSLEIFILKVSLFEAWAFEA
ncbi:hypothetical protein [Roseofilum sp. Guam]|uniref:hypothetical protein n=1 Tax=Roseofilum sp. Guam TaxID=2821502 RepID=UPI001B07E8E4|nr:hypothetical protein [Roseofilum sp. Guam]MBP0027812.1 hypothetical protein [Roseofilum sp. Guam]